MATSVAINSGWGLAYFAERQANVRVHCGRCREDADADRGGRGDIDSLVGLRLEAIAGQRGGALLGQGGSVGGLAGRYVGFDRASGGLVAGLVRSRRNSGGGGGPQR